MRKFLFFTLATLTVTCSNAGTVAYFTSTAGEPWGVSDFTNAMSTVFGSYTTYDYETANASPFSAGTSFVFMEGAAGNDTALQTFLTNYSTNIVSWVNAGGRLMIDSAGWDNSINTGFSDIVLNQGQYSSNATEVGTQPIFAGPYTPVATSLTGGYFSHDTVTGTGLTPMITGDSGTIAAYESFGSGMVLFSGATAPSFQNPQPDSFNLLNNELAFASGGAGGEAPEPGTLFLLGAGLLGAGMCRRKLHSR